MDALTALWYKLTHPSKLLADRIETMDKTIAEIERVCIDKGEMNTAEKIARATWVRR